MYDINKRSIIPNVEVTIHVTSVDVVTGIASIDVTPSLNMENGKAVNGSFFTLYNMPPVDILKGFICYSSESGYTLSSILCSNGAYDIATYFEANDTLKLYVPQKQSGHNSYATINDFYEEIAAKSKANVHKFDSNGSVVTTVEKDTNHGLLSATDKAKLNTNKIRIYGDDKTIETTFTNLLYIKEQDGKDYELCLFSGNSFLNLSISMLSNGQIHIINNGYRQASEVNGLVCRLKRYTKKDDSNIKFVGFEFMFKDSAVMMDYYLSTNNIEDISALVLNDYNITNLTMNDGAESFELEDKLVYINNYTSLKTGDSGQANVWMIANNTDLRVYTKPGEYYRQSADLTSLSSLPATLSGPFDMTIYYDAVRVCRYVIVGNNNQMFVGHYDGTNIIWKTVLTYGADKSEFPAHNHLASDITTDANNRFVTDEFIQRCIAIGYGNNVWTIYQHTVLPSVVNYTIQQALLKKYYLLVSSNLSVYVSPKMIGMEGLNVIRNTSTEAAINITLYLPTALTDVVHEGMSPIDMTYEVPIGKSMEIYYMVLNENTIVIKTKLFDTIVNNNTFTAVGEDGLLEF